MDELLEQFLLEGRELVAQATTDLRALESRADDRASLDSAFRAVHTLKGSVAIFAFLPAEQVLHAAEDILEAARKGGGALSASALASLTAVIDTVDRWIDDIEQAGRLPENAGAVAGALVARLADEHGEGAGVTSAEALNVRRGGPSWSAALLDHLRSNGADMAAPMTLFRYTPDTDCFFRGEDPLALAMAVPDLVSLRILPAGAAWPEAEAFEPFSCTSLVEGASTASEEAVRGAFRLVPDQVEIHAALPDENAEGAHLADRETRGADVLRVDAARVDALADGLGELIVAVNAVAKLGEAAGSVDRALG
ncbi:MAG TPA: Hpt domain-containing protein, partial [Sphingopyxis sp.]|uniref:Hpt domain-containing protein n=1 Tax=Sphingopyxis sp. TaxID=1908224 RepID=UPI002C5E7DF5